MTLLAIIGALILTYICWMPIRNVLWFLTMSDYGIVETIRNCWKKERLWIEFALIPVACVIWWFVVGTRITIGFG